VITEPLFLGTLTPYAIVLACCAAGGLWLSSLLNKGILTHLIDGGTIIALVSVLGGRISFVLLNIAYYQDHLLEIPQLWLGGLSWPGALLGAVLSVLLVHWIWKESLGELADSYLPLLGLLAVGAWLAGWGAGIGYGPGTDAWFGIPVRDIFGTVEKRWPLPVLGAVLSGAWTAGAILYPLRRHHPAGTRGLLGAAGLLAINALVSFFRVDPAPELLGLRLESWLSLLFLAAFWGGYYLLIKDKIDHEEAGT
jgi:prolipoprotein diacylglyceryltransferase